MNALERFSGLVETIYDAALDRTLWPAVLEDTARYVGGGAATLSTTSTDTAFDMYYDWGSDPAYMQLMATTYASIYPLPPLIMAYAQPGDVIWGDKFMPYDTFTETRFYREWAAPQGLVDAVGVVLEKSASRFASVTVTLYQQHGRVDHGVRERMGLLGSHYRRAVTIGRLLEQHDEADYALASAIENLAAGVFILDRNGRLIHRNASGAQMLASREPLSLQSGRLSVAQNDAFDAALLAASRPDGAAASVPLSDMIERRWMAHILPLASRRHRVTQGREEAHVAVFVQEVTLEQPAALEAIARFYRLTPAEVRVMVAVIDTQSAVEIADRVGCAETTARRHLHNIFEKTGARRQADLVRILASFSGPATASAPDPL